MSLISPRMDKIYKLQHFDHSFAEVTTTNTYVTLDTLDLRGKMNCTIRLKNTHATGAIKYKVLGSIDGTNFDIEIQAETVVVASDVDIIVKPSYYIPYVAVSVKSSVADTPGKALVTIACV